MAMICCPRCGFKNPDTATNCAQCRINIQFALEHREEIESQIQAAEQNATMSQQVNEKAENLLVTTTPTIQGKIITEYVGIVSSTVVLGTGFLSELSASLADTFGTRSTSFQDKLSVARETALRELKTQAIRRGGDAIVGLDLEYLTIAANMLVVNACGTAVRLSRNDLPNPETL